MIVVGASLATYGTRLTGSSIIIRMQPSHARAGARPARAGACPARANSVL